MKRYLKVFGVFFALYLLTWGGHYTSGDGAQKIAWTKRLLYGTATAGVPKFGIGHSLIAMPAIAASVLIRRYTGIKCEAALYTLIFIANGALLLALIAFYLFHLYAPGRVWLTVSLIGLATKWWPYTKMDFSEPLVATILFAGFVIMRFGRPVLGMFLAAFTITIRTDAVVLIVLLAAWWLFEHFTVGSAVRIGLAIVPSALLVAAANYARYHSVFDRGYATEGFSTPLVIGLDGILFSAGKSVFLFSPPLVMGFLGWKRFHERSATRTDAILFLAVFVAELIVYSKWWDWSSDDAWGVRFMIPAVVLMCIPAVEVFEKRLLVVTVATVGLYVQLLAVLVGGLDYLMLIRTDKAIDLEDIRFNPRYSQIAGNWIILRHLLHVPPHLQSPGLSEEGITPLYDTLPPRAWSAAACWDFAWARYHRR